MVDIGKVGQCRKSIDYEKCEMHNKSWMKNFICANNLLHTKWPIDWLGETWVVSFTYSWIASVMNCWSFEASWKEHICQFVLLSSPFFMTSYFLTKKKYEQTECPGDISLGATLGCFTTNTLIKFKHVQPPEHELWLLQIKCHKP